MADAPIPPESFDSQSSILEFVLQLFYQKMTDPTNDDYLPKLVPELDDPNLDPYTTSSDWPLTNLSGSGIQAGSDQICMQGTPSKYSPAVGISSTAPNLTLSNIEIDGLVNVLPEAPSVTDPDSDAPKVSVALDFCTVQDGSLPKAIAIKGSFTIDQCCCIPARGSQTCSGADPTFDVPGDGTFVATLSPPTTGEKIKMVNHGTITVDADQQFVFTLTEVQPSIPNAALNTTVHINSSDPHRDTFQKLAEEALNSDSGKAQLIAAFAAELTSDSTLSEISTMITQKINQVL